MKVGTDGVLLGAWVSLDTNPDSILDIGAGTGLIALMLAQRSTAETIDALEIDEAAFEQCVENFEASPWGDRLFCYHAGLDEFVTEWEDTYDLIVCNPPFYSEDVSSGNVSRDTARQNAALPFEELLNGAAALDAVSKIKQNLEKFLNKKYNFKKKKIIYEKGLIKFNNKSFKFDSIIKDAYLNRISLSSSGFYSTPKIHFDKKKFLGRPFLYFCYGASVTEVLVDTLTGENIVERVDILHDAGKAINPALELGQIEGGFVQGQGWLTMEEVNWNSNGKIMTVSPSTYKIPAVSDMPKKFNVEIFKNGINKEKVVNKAKTTGEPPLMLAMSVFFAIKDAISSVENYKIIPILDAPATPEKILMSLNKLGNRDNHIKK